MSGLLQKTTKLTDPKGVISNIQGLDDKDDFPIPSYQFSVEIGDKVVALFQSISGMSVTRNLESFKEGGRNNHEIELPGNLSYGHITLKTGLTSPDFFWKWMMDGQYEGYVNGSTTVTLKQRRSTKDGIEDDYLTWEFTNVFPVRWSISELSVNDSSSIVIEELELTFDYFTPTAG